MSDYTAALTLCPDNSFALYNRGITKDRMGDYAGAVEDFTAAAALDPSNADFYHNRGFSLRKQVGGGAGGLAGSLVQPGAAGCRPNASNDNMLTLADPRLGTAAPQGCFEAAIADYTRAIELNPGHCRAYYNRAFSRDRLGRCEEAIADYSRALEIEPGNPAALHNRGSLALES